NYNLWVTNYVLNFPFFGLLFMRYIYPQILDSVFIESLRHVDYVYLRKHEGENDLRPPYAPALERYEYSYDWMEMFQYLKRSFVYPIASAYTLVRSLGYKPAITVGVLMYITPGTKPLAIFILENLFSSRALMRELLEPYFGRIHFETKVRRRWFEEREGILFGFSIAFYQLVKLPLIGMLFYGVAQAAAALVLVKTTEPPPPPDLLSTYRIDYRYRDPREKKIHKE
ncbi:12463_t:CDS:2, partial [Acaulospora morrowiae]